MSTPVLDKQEKKKILSIMHLMRPVEQEIIKRGFQTSHLSGRLLMPPEIPFSEKVSSFLFRKHLPSQSFTQTVKLLIEKDIFAGIDCTAQHYLTKAWEIYKVLSFIPFAEQEGLSVLNVGGASTLINFFLAWQGVTVTSIDRCERDGQIVENEKEIARELNLNITSIDRDFLAYVDNKVFDFVFSLCVIEHLDSREQQKRFINHMKRFVRKGGLLLLTFGFGPRASQNPFRDEGDVDRYIYQNLSDFSVISPFYFNDVWTISEGHTWGFIAVKKV